MENKEKKSCDGGRHFQRGRRSLIRHSTQMGPYKAAYSSLHGSPGSSWLCWCLDSPSPASRRTLTRYIISSIHLSLPISVDHSQLALECRIFRLWDSPLTSTRGTASCSPSSFCSSRSRLAQ